VRGTIGLDVIYGDTDSVMVHTGSDDLEKAVALGRAIQKEVNKRCALRGLC